MFEGKFSNPMDDSMITQYTSYENHPFLSCRPKQFQLNFALALRGGSPSKRPELAEESELEERKKELKKRRRLKKKSKELQLLAVRTKKSQSTQYFFP